MEGPQMDLSNAGDVLEDILIRNRMVGLQKTTDLMKAKIVEIFHYDGLPLTLPKRILEGYVTGTGSAVVYQFDGELFVSDVKPSARPNVYGENTEVRITHKAGDVNENLVRTIGVDAVLVRNDAYCLGLESLITEFALMTTQGKITMLNSMVNLRTNYIIQAKDEAAFAGAMEFERAIRRGDTAVMLAEEFSDLEGVAVHNTPVTGNQTTQAIELFQFIQAYYYSELGVTLNNNMKSQYVSDTEIEKSTGMPLIHNMLAMREEAARDIKALFDVDISVSLSSEWKDTEDDTDSMPTIDTEDHPEAVEENADDTPEQTGSEDTPDDLADGAKDVEPEAEPVTAEELIDATEATLGEEVDHAEDDPGASGTDPDSDSGEDSEERADVEPEEGDDED